MGVGCGVYSPRRFGLLPFRPMADGVVSDSAREWPGIQGMMAIENQIEVMYEL
jgi:hypothetical protein